MDNERRERDRRRGIDGVSAGQHIATIILVVVIFGFGWFVGHFGPG